MCTPSDFRRYLASWVLVNLGTQMLGVAVGWQVYSLTHRALDLGYVGLVQFVPVFALSLVAGNVADRVHRPRLVALCHFALATCALALALLPAGLSSVAPIYGILFCVGVARAFDAPASQALVPTLVPRETLPTAVAWTSTAWQVSTILGPAVGGALYGITKQAGWVYGSAAVLLLAASALVLGIRSAPSPAEHQKTTWKEVLAGLSFVRAHRVILHAVSLDLFAVLLGGATALLPIFASDVLHTGPLGLGALRGAPAIGAAAMAVALAHRPLRRNAGPLMLACVALFGVATVVFGLSRSLVLSLVALVVLGASDMVSVVVRGTVIQLRTPDAMRGRVSAVSMLFIATSSELGELESGLTAAWLGAVPAVTLGGVGTIVVAAVYAFCFTSLRSIDGLGDTNEPGLQSRRAPTS